MTEHLRAFTLADLVRQQAQTLPEVIALAAPGVSLSYWEVDRRTDELAAWLHSLGVEPGGRVAWHGPDDHELVLLMFAVAKLGGHTVPLNWRCTDAELAGMLAGMRPDLLVTAEHPRAPDRSWPERQPVADLADARTTTAREVPELSEDDDTPVLGFFTAAWTGTPKLALIPDRAIVTQSLVLGAYRQIDVVDEVYLASGPMFHIGALVNLFGNYLFGNKIVLAPSASAVELCAVIESERVTNAYLFTPTIDQLVAANENGRWDLSSLARAPAPPSPELADSWYAMTSCRRADAADPTGYGQTETWAMASYTARGPATAARFGRPSPVVSVRIMDGERAAPPGSAGEITVRGPQVMTGYANQRTTDAWHRTGDLGARTTDGGIEFYGPLQAMIKSGMENVYPAEVEAVLGRHPAVEACCVIGVPDPVWGERVAAAVVARPEQQLDLDGLSAFVAEHIAGYKKPRQYLVLAALPSKEAGIDRDVIRALLESTRQEENTDAAR